MRKHFNSLHTRLCPHSPSQTMASLSGWQGVMLLPQNPRGLVLGRAEGCTHGVLGVWGRDSRGKSISTPDSVLQLSLLSAHATFSFSVITAQIAQPHSFWGASQVALMVKNLSANLTQET